LRRRSEALPCGKTDPAVWGQVVDHPSNTTRTHYLRWYLLAVRWLGLKPSKRVREFTPEEKAFGMETLLGLLDSLQKFVDPKESQGNSSP
jgi:hypothetical protein